MNPIEIKNWIENNLVLQDKAIKITKQSKSAFNQSVQTGKIKPFVEFGESRKTRLYFIEDLKEYASNKKGGNKIMESLDNVYYKGKTLSNIAGLIRKEQGIYTATFSDKNNNPTDKLSNHYKVYWDLNDFFETENKHEIDWEKPHFISELGNIHNEKHKRKIELNIKHVSKYPIYNKGYDMDNKQITLLHRPVDLYPGLADRIYWSLAKDHEDNYYKVYWNIINMHDPIDIVLTVDNSRYCKHCLKSWENEESICTNVKGHEYVPND